MFVYIANNWLWLTLSGKQRKVPQQLLPCSSIVIDCLRSLLSLPVWDVDRPLGSQWFRWGSSANKSLTICYLCRSQSNYRMVFKLCSNWNINLSTTPIVLPPGQTDSSLLSSLSSCPALGHVMRKVATGPWLSFRITFPCLFFHYKRRRSRKVEELSTFGTHASAYVYTWAWVLLIHPIIRKDTIHPFRKSYRPELESPLFEISFNSCPSSVRWLWSEIKWPYVMVNGRRCTKGHRHHLGHKCSTKTEDSKTLAAV